MAGGAESFELAVRTWALLTPAKAGVDLGWAERHFWSMSLYAIIAPGEDANLTAAVVDHFPEHYKVAPGQFLISSKLTTQEVSVTIEAPGGKVGKVLIIRAENQTGWHAKDMWEWIASQAAKSAISDG